MEKLSINPAQGLGPSSGLGQRLSLEKKIGVQNRSVSFEERTDAVFTYKELRRLLWAMRPYGSSEYLSKKGTLLDLHS